MIECPHDFLERETAVTADGYCPLCLAALNTELLAALEKIVDLAHYPDRALRVPPSPKLKVAHDRAADGQFNTTHQGNKRRAR